MMEAHIWTHLAALVDPWELWGSLEPCCAELNGSAFAAWGTLTHRAWCRKLVMVVARWRRWF